jgi:hypothetical protein
MWGGARRRAPPPSAHAVREEWRARRARRLCRTAVVVAAVLVVPVLGVADVLPVVPVVPVVPTVVVPDVVVVPVDPGDPGSPVHAHATPLPPASVSTVVATATADRCFLILRPPLVWCPVDRAPAVGLTVAR